MNEGSSLSHYLIALWLAYFLIEDLEETICVGWVDVVTEGDWSVTGVDDVTRLVFDGSYPGCELP